MLFLVKINYVPRLFDLTLQLNGFPLGKAKRVLEKILAVPEPEYAQFMEAKKAGIAGFHLKHNPFYRSLAGTSTYTNWQDLPVMHKADFQRPLKQRLSDGYSMSSVFINKTSGSSGHPMTFAKDKECHALTWASIIEKFGWFGIDFNTSKQARFYGIPLDFTGYRKERLKDFLGRRFRFPVFDLSDKALAAVLSKFETTKFDYVNGYTSSIVLFAKFLRSKNLILKDVCPTLKVCAVTSEMLFDDDKKLLESQFNIPIVNEYGASELDLIAFQNPQGDWQVNSETLFVEILDDDGNALPNGSEGRIVITSFYNKAHPFIRYDIGDTGILDERSTAKKPILKKLTGRTNDIAVLPSGKISPGLTFYYVTKSIIEDDGNVTEFVIKQTGTNMFEVEYVSRDELSESQLAGIRKAIATYLEEGLNFIFTRKDKLDRGKSGKLKQFVSLINQNP
jgi:phenylacetate-CoA ligase